MKIKIFFQFICYFFISVSGFASSEWKKGFSMDLNNEQISRFFPDTDFPQYIKAYIKQREHRLDGRVRNVLYNPNKKDFIYVNQFYRLHDSLFIESKEKRINVLTLSSILETKILGSDFMQKLFQERNFVKQVLKICTKRTTPYDVVEFRRMFPEFQKEECILLNLLKVYLHRKLYSKIRKLMQLPENLTNELSSEEMHKYDKFVQTVQDEIYESMLLSHQKYIKQYLETVKKYLNSFCTLNDTNINSLVQNALNQINVILRSKFIWGYLDRNETNSCMAPIWDMVHTEYELLFDVAAEANAEGGWNINPEKIPKGFSFLSYYDSCEKCEHLEAICVEKMKEDKEIEKNGMSYKMFVGSYQQCDESRGSRCENTPLLKEFRLKYEN